MLGLIGVGAAVLFSGYSQILRTNVNITNSLATKNDLNGNATTMAATSILSVDTTLLCPPTAGGPSAECTSSYVKLTAIAGQSQLPASTSGVAGSGGSAPKEVGIFTAGSGMKQLDAWGHYYIVCRWENPTNPGSGPAFMIISGGPDGTLQTKCTDTQAQGDDLIIEWPVTVAINRSAVWQATVSNGNTTSVQFGQTGTQLVVDAAGDLTIPSSATLTAQGTDALGHITASSISDSGSLSAGSGTFSGALSGSSLTVSGAATIGTTLGVTGATSLSTLSTSGVATLNSATVSGNATIGGTLGVTGATTLGSLGVAGNTTVGGTLGVTGDTNLGSTLETGGLATLNSAAVTNNATIGGTLGVTGATSLSSLSTSGNASVGGTLTVTGVSHFTGTLNGSNAVFTGSVQASNFIGSVAGSSIVWGTSIVPLANGGTSYAASSPLDLLGYLGGTNASNLTLGTLPAGRIAAGEITSAMMAAPDAASEVGPYYQVYVDSAGRVVTGSSTIPIPNEISDGVGESITADSNGLTFDTSNTARMRINMNGNIAIGTTTANVSLDLSKETDALALPSGTTAQRPSSPVNGDIRYNSTAGITDIEAYINGSWSSIATTTGGTGIISGVILGTSAAATNPQRSGDVTTGLFSPAVGTVSIASGGVEITRTSAHGLAIGTSYVGTTPPVNGAIIQGGVGLGTSTVANVLDVNGSLAVGSFAGAATGASNELVVGGGNVGIGTASPSSLLHIVDASTPTVTYKSVEVAATATSSTASVTKTGMDIQSTGTWNGAGATNIGLNVNATGGTTNYAALFNGGNVGVGTTSPAYNLVVRNPSGTANIALSDNAEAPILFQTGASSSGQLSLVGGNGNNLVQFDLNNARMTIGGASTSMPLQVLGGGAGGDALFSQTNPVGIVVQVRGGASQTADLQEWQNSSSSVLASVSAAGGAYFASSVGIGTATPQVALDLTQKTDAIALPSGTTAQRPSGGVANGDMRYSQSLNAVEAYINGAWDTLLTSAGSTSGVNLGTAANATNPSRTGQLGTGFYSDTSNEVQVAINGNNLVTWSASAENLNGTITQGSYSIGYQINGNNAIWQDAANANLAVGATAFPTTVSQAGGGGNGQNNVAVGYQALNSNTTGYFNTATGEVALANNTTGAFNSAFGRGALQGNTSGQANAALGYNALNSNTGSYNTGIGTGALQHNTTGTNNTVLGYNVANGTLNGGSNNILIGTSIAVTTATATTNYNLNIGNLLQGDMTNSTALGTEALFLQSTASSVDYLQIAGAATTNAPVLSAQGTDTNISIELLPKGTGGVGIGTASPSYALDVAGTGRFGSNLTITGTTLTTPSNGGILVLNGGTAGGGTNAITFQTQGTNAMLVGGWSASQYAVEILSVSTSFPVLIVQGRASQTSDLQDWENSSGAVLTEITAAGNLGIGTTTPQVALDLTQKTDAIALPSGTSAQRPSGGVANGDIRYSQSLNAVEAYINGAWDTLLTSAGSTSGVNLGTAASATNPSRTSEITTGFYSLNPGEIDAAVNVSGTGTQIMKWTSGGENIVSGTLTVNNNGILSSPSSATFHLGAADAASPVAQTLGVQNVVGGTTNTAGTNFTINGSQGTGTGAGGSILFQTAPAGGTGSTQNALATAMTITSAGHVGIGTATPANVLDVNGSLAVGTYAGTAAGASNELIVSGDVSIGTSIPTHSLTLSSTAASSTTGATTSAGKGIALYDTTDQTTNYQRATLYMDTQAGDNSFIIRTENGGTGTQPPLNVFSNGVALNWGAGRLSLQSSSAGSDQVVTETDKTLIIYGDVRTANNTTNISFQTFGSIATTAGLSVGVEAKTSFAPISGNAQFIGLDIDPIVNQTGTASGNYTALQIRPTVTAATGTNQLLIDAGTVASPAEFVVTGGGNVGIGSTTPNSSLDISQKTDAVSLPSGTSAQRPTPVAGMLRYNNSVPQLEAYYSGAWNALTTGGAGATINLGTAASATNPQRNGDATTGLFSPATGAVSIASAGSEIERVTGGVAIGTSYVGTAPPSNGAIIQGNVGIGTTGPDQILTINAGTGINSLVSFKQNGSTAAYTGLGTDARMRVEALTGTELRLQEDGNSAPMTFYQNNSEIMRIHTNGNVGIGTTSPAETLDVEGSGGVILNAGNVAIGTTTATYPVDISGGSCGSTCNFLRMIRNSGLVYYAFTNSSLTISTGSIILPAPQGSTGTTIAATNGTGNSGTYLAINGASNQNNSSGIGGTLSIGGLFNGSGTASYNVMQIAPTLNFSGTGNYTALYINPTETATGSGTNYLINAAVGGTSKYVVTDTGSVGIGTATPTSVLHLADSTAKTANYIATEIAASETSSTASINKTGVDIQSTGTWNGTSAVNTGLNVNVSGGTTNYAALFNGGNIGIGTTAPNSLLTLGNTSTSGTLSFNGPNGTDTESVQVSYSGSLFGTDVAGLLFQNTVGARFAGITVNGMGSTSVKLNSGTITASWNGPTSSNMLTLQRSGSARLNIFDDVISNNDIQIQGNGTENLDFASFAAIGLGSTAPNSSLDISQKTDAVSLPSGTSAQRPSPVNGMLRYNQTNSALETYANSAWTSLTTGGNVTINLGTAASATDPQRSGEATTGLFSANSGRVSVAVNVAGTGTDVADFNSTGINILGTVTSGSDMPSLQINGNNAIWQDTTYGNIAVGPTALPTTNVQTGGGSNGQQNTALGYQALNTNSLGYQNTAVGYQALLNNTTGTAKGTVSGRQNTAVGASALAANTTGVFNTAVGAQALQLNTKGNDNTALGASALAANTTGLFNTAVGVDALLANTTGGSNTALGVNTLQANTTGGNNTAVGLGALIINTTGSNNTVLGYNVGSTTQATGSGNILIGTSSSVDVPSDPTNNFLNIGNVIFATGMTGTVAAPAGSVGIGTTAPGLVAGASKYLTMATTGNYNYPAFEFTNANPVSTHPVGRISFADTAEVARIESLNESSYGVGTLVFYTSASTGAIGERMRIDQNGYVGVGTASPAGILDVEGGTTSSLTTATNIVLTAQSTTAAGTTYGGNVNITSGHGGYSGAVNITTAQGDNYSNGGDINITTGGNSAFGGNGNLTIGIGAGSCFSGCGTVSIVENNATQIIVTGSGGYVGIGTTSPNAKLVVNGHIETTGTSPAVSSCGTSPSIAGNDNVGTITVGTSSSLTCTITFATAWNNPPTCFAMNNNSGRAPVFQIQTTTTTMVVTDTAAIGKRIADGDTLRYLCSGYE